MFTSEYSPETGTIVYRCRRRSRSIAVLTDWHSPGIDRVSRRAIVGKNSDADRPYAPIDQSWVIRYQLRTYVITNAVRKSRHSTKVPRIS